MERYRRSAVFIMVFAFFSTTLVLITELPLLAPDIRLTYAITKLLITTSGLGVAYWLHKDISSQTANTLAGVLLFGYCCHGQLFRPTYYFGFTQILAVYSFLFPISKIRFRIVTCIGSIAFALVTYLTWDHFQTIRASLALSDVLQVILISAIIAFACNNFFASERTIRDEYLQRFAQMGVQTARTVHDLKGLIAAPKLYAQILETKYAGEIQPEAVEILKLLSRDLESLQGVLKELNQLSVTDPHSTEYVALHDVTNSLQLLLSKQLSGIELRCLCKPDAALRCQRSTLTSLLLNLVLNSATAFARTHVEAKTIGIDLVKNCLSVRDNAGGMDPEILRNLKRENFRPAHSESGMGLLFVTEEMQKLGGNVEFSSSTSGTDIRLTFPKRLVKS